MLAERGGGIPEQQWNYWADPEYRIDRSIKDPPKGVFERNGNPGEDAYVHPHFIPYLRYFLFGVYLPSPVIETFEEEVGDPASVTSGDIVPLGDPARKLTRQSPDPRLIFRPHWELDPWI